MANTKISTTEDEESFMRQWEMGSPMRTFIYYLQRATCGALFYLVIHQMVLGLRLVGAHGILAQISEWSLLQLSIPGRFILQTFCDPVRPLHLPPPLAEFFLNILVYFAVVWLACYLYNFFTRNTFLGKRRDPFTLLPK